MSNDNKFDKSNMKAGEAAAWDRGYCHGFRDFPSHASQYLYLREYYENGFDAGRNQGVLELTGNTARWEQLDESEAPKLKSAAELAYDEGFDEGFDKMPMTADRYTTVILRSEYISGYYEGVSQRQTSYSGPRNSIVEAPQRQSATDVMTEAHQRGMNDGLSGLESSAALRTRVEFKASILRELYWKGYEAGTLIKWGSDNAPPQSAD